MEFSLFNLMTMPGNGPTPAQVFEQMRTMTRMADQGGFDIAWFAEHHLSNYSVCPSPLMAVAHMAPVTEHLQLGPAVVVMPFYEPLRLVQDICMADQLSNGRLVLGLGTGYQPREFSKFGFEINDRLQRGLEIWDVIHQGLTLGRIDYQGDHVSISDATLSITPVQDDIRTFVVGNAPEVRQRMVERGVTPLTSSALAPTSLLSTLRGLYKKTRAENGLTGDDFPFAVQRYVYVAKDSDDARMAAEQILLHARMVTNMRQPVPELDGAILRDVPYEGEPTIDEIMERSLIGDAEDVSARIVSDALEYGITHISVFMQIAGIPYPNALRSLETFCDRVIPAVRSGLANQSQAAAS